jgi:hypothetical protein
MMHPGNPVLQRWQKMMRQCISIVFFGRLFCGNWFWLGLPSWALSSFLQETGEARKGIKKHRSKPKPKQ